jgi:sigma-B regulation protein RsbU (phosphoserine phosphatase)
MLLGMEYEYEEFDFHPSDRLVLYSDGISECVNPEGEQFSSERLAASLCDKGDLSLQSAIKYMSTACAAGEGVIPSTMT